MKIKSSVGHNVSFHKVPNCTIKGAPDYLTIPAGATIELEDSLWLGAFASSKGLVGSLATGAITIVVHAASELSVEEIVERLYVAGVKVDPSKSKEEVQAMAIKLGVDLSENLEVVVEGEEGEDTEEDESED